MPMLKTNDVLCIPINIRIIEKHGHADTIYYLCQCESTPIGVIPNGAPYFLVSEHALSTDAKISKKEKEIPDVILRWGLLEIEKLDQEEIEDDEDD